MIKFNCPICGHAEFDQKHVLWKELIEDWELTDTELNIMEMQQGLCCGNCQASLRIMNIANGFNIALEHKGTVKDFVNKWRFRNIKVLDINGLDSLSDVLKKLRGYKQVSYPEINLLNLENMKEKYDFIIHSDTLEHLDNPSLALKNVQKCLKKDGFQIFTVPIINTKLSRSRKNLKNSYHGKSDLKPDDFLVHFEFGADFNKYLFEAEIKEYRVSSITGDESFAYIIQNKKDSKWP